MTKMELSNKGDSYKAMKGESWGLSARKDKREDSNKEALISGPSISSCFTRNQAGGPSGEIQESQV